MSDLALIIQARLGSTRLPQKMILPFYEGKSIFELLLDRLIRTFPELKIVLATSINSENDALEEMALSKGILVFRGNENDVLDRYIKAADFYNVSNIIRVCGDNPFLDTNELKRLINHLKMNPVIHDYISFKVNDTPSIKTHFGFWTEFVRLEALKKVKVMTDDKLYREHVTNYIYSNPDIFKVSLLNVNPQLEVKEYIRMTLDTRADFDLLSEIYHSMLNGKDNEDFTIDDIICLIDNNPEYVLKMKKQINENTK